LTITQLDFIFAINNLEVADIKRNAPKLKQNILYPLVWLLRLVSRLSSEKSRKKHRTDLTLDDRVVMGGNNVIFVTRKREQPLASA